jgi:hypothetical protein
MRLSNLKLSHLMTALAAGAFAAGCSTVGGGDIASIYQLAKTSWSGDQKVSLEEAASVPYASMGLRVGHSNQVMIILASDQNGEQLWTSSARIAITTLNGRIIRTAGLGHNLAGYQEQHTVPSEADHEAVRWLADFPELDLYSVSISCERQNRGEETIMILGQAIRTRRIDESCAVTNHGLDWSFHNTYWTDPASGLVWRSIQHVNPKLDVIETEMLRPPA